MGDRRHAQLTPLHECITAAITLREHGVTPALPIGWAPAYLAFTTRMLAIRPGAQITVRFDSDPARFYLTGGIVIADDGGIDEHMAAWYTIETICALTCRTCGRPGRKHSSPAGVYCDACRYLATRPDATALPFTPRLPLPDETIQAITDLGNLNPAALTATPTGWVRLVNATLRDTPPAFRTAMTFNVREDCVSFAGEASSWSAELRELNDRLVVNSRVHCRRCSRRMTEGPGDRDYSSVCAGCRWVESRGWEIVTAEAVTPPWR